jgi:uncharacterized protein (DUF1501 family)
MTGFDYNVPPTNPRSVALTDLLTTETGLSLVQVGNGIVSNSISDARQLAAALKGTSVADYNFGPSGKTSLALQLQQVAQIIKAREGLNMQRQIFFCSLGGFDTHTIELETHNKLYPILNDALASFYNYVASNITGISSENVTLFTESDFSRTFQPTTGDGSDHAWGSHHLILGGAVKGQSVYFNTFPPFALGQGDDFDTRGRWIPSSAVDQYGETLVKWFGLNSSAVFPNLVNPDGSLRFGPNMLQFL